MISCHLTMLSRDFFLLSKNGREIGHGTGYARSHDTWKTLELVAHSHSHFCAVSRRYALLISRHINTSEGAEESDACSPAAPAVFHFLEKWIYWEQTAEVPSCRVSRWGRFSRSCSPGPHQISSTLHASPCRRRRLFARCSLVTSSV